ncbi:endonuclease domain-containing protein [Hymenobacter sp.]|jgi:very-short-patch-repair endonuclease|uniref:endonuclease domain-containing protein n=1 Tax=Hymenobacter sp. TaxID=1898978 RepID=UPI002ED8EFFD
MSEESSTIGQRHAFTTDAERWAKQLKAFSRANRKQPTEAENALWQALRGIKLGYKFRRQHALDRYIVDFVCLRAWLIVEADGEIHTETGQAEYDAGRTHVLEELGFRILRFTNDQILTNINQTLETIKFNLARSLGSPSPQGEEAGG